MSFSSGGGSGSLHTDSDVALSNPVDGHALVYNGTSAKWQNQSLSASGLSATAVKTGAYSASTGQFIPCDATSAGFAVTLPSAPADKSQVSVKKIDSSANVITVTAGGSDVFNKASGSTSISLALLNQGVTLQYAATGGIWYVLSDDIPLSQTDARYMPIKLPTYAPSSLQNYFDIERSAYNFKASNTRRWSVGLAEAANGKATCEVWIGDSIMGGCTNINGYVFDRLHAIPRQYESALSAKGIPIAGTGIVPAYDGTHIDARWSWTGGWGGSQISCAQCQQANSVATFTSNLAGTVVTVYIYDYTSGNVTVSVNGATSGSNFMTITFGGTHTWKSFTMSGVTGLTAGSTVAIKTTTATLVVLAGVEVRATTGLSVHNLALSGSEAAGSGADCWTDTSSNYYPIQIWGAYQSQMYQEIPSVVHMGLMFFDVQNNTLSAYITAVTAIRNMFPNSDFIIHATPQPEAYNSSQWYPFLSALYTLADTLDVPIFDIQNLLGGYTTELALGINGDNLVHLSTDAYSLWGRGLTRLAGI